MLNSFRKLSSQNLGRPIRSLLFFILFYLYLWLEVDLRLIYHSGETITNFPVFFRGWAFFQESTSYPGDPVEYLSAFLFQFFYIGWAGAVVVTLQAWLICVCTDYFLKAINTSSFRWLRFVPPVLLLITYTQYTYNFVTTMALLVALLFICLYLRITPKNTLRGLVVFLILSLILYYFVGGAYLLYAVLCGIFESFHRRRWVVGILCLLSVLLTPFLANTLVFDLNLIDAYRRMLPFGLGADRGGVILKFGLLLFFPMAGFCCALWRLFTQKRKSSKGKSGRARRFLEYYRKSKLKCPLEMLALLIVAAGAVLLTCDRIARINLRIDYFARHKMWPQLLREARKLPVWHYSVFVRHDVNRALYHTGRLLYEMFSYPNQHFDSLLLTTEEHLYGGMLLRKWVKSGDALYELGHIDKAEHVTSEALAVLNYYPVGLQRLALINIVKGETDTARIFLRALSKDFLYADWAKRYLRRLETDPLLSTDEEIQRMRSLMLVKDSVSVTTPKDLLDRNKHNRMAFEYLTAFLLLTGQYAPVARNVGYLDNFDYPKGEIPRHYEEAILLYTVMTSETVNLHGRRINVNTVRRFEEFWRRSQRYKHDMHAARKALAKDFGDTYYYHYLFGRSELAK